MYNYFNFGYHPINESRSLIEGNTEWILSLETIRFIDIKTKEEVEVPCRDFIKLVDMALGRIESRYPFISPYIMHSKIMYVPYSDGMHDTMCVDSRKNLWINMPFVYNYLNMDIDRVYGIIFHELMHNVLGHLDKIAKKFPIAKRLAMGELAWDLELKKINVCTDMEVNCDMVADDVVTETFWEKLEGVYDKKYTGKMWEQIYTSDGDSLFKEYCGGDKLGEKTTEVLKAFEEYAEKVSKPEATERDKVKAKDELEKKLEEILGKDPSKKDKTKTIKKALERLRSSYLKDIGDLKEILDELIDIYLINPEEFNGDDYNRAVEAINKFENSLIENIVQICSESMHLEESSFKAYISKCMNLFRDNTKTVFEGKSTLTNEEIDDLNLDVAEALWVLLEDEEAKEKSEKKREKEKEKARKERKEKARKEREEAKERSEKKERKERRKRHILFGLFKKLANISNLISVKRVSEETSEISRDIAKGIQKILDIPVEDIKIETVKPFIDMLPSLGESLKKDLIILYDKHIILDKTTSELNDSVDKTIDSITNALSTVADSSTDISKKMEVVVKSLGDINEIGRMLRTKKRTRPSEEFKKAYKKEMERLTKLAKEKGKEEIAKHLKDMGFSPDTDFEGTGEDIEK